MERCPNSHLSNESHDKRRFADGNKAREEKRRKWEAKQARKRETNEIESTRFAWIQQHEGFSTWVTEEDSDKVHCQERGSLVSRIESLLIPYVDIQDSNKSIAGNLGPLSHGERLFVAEGTETIRLLIQQSTQTRQNGLNPIELKSIFVKPSVLFENPVNLLGDVEDTLKTRGRNGDDGSHPGFHVLVGSEATLSRVAGFQISRGALACGVIPNDCDEAWLQKSITNRMNESDLKKPKIRLLALDGICDTANLGAMIRCASAFGIDAVVLSKDTCEAWYRKSIRTSMGHIFRVPVVRVDDLANVIQGWRVSYPELHSFAAVIDTDFLLQKLQHGQVRPSWCCVLGNEGDGISSEVAEACTRRIRIDMEAGVDSLSVPIACGIILHGLREREIITG